MASNIYGAIALTGGTDGAVDTIKDAVINDGDMCIAIVGGATDTTYIYTFDDSNATAESSPSIIKPDDAAGNGRWVLTNLHAQDITTVDDLTVGDDLTVTGLATIGETLGVTGAVTFSSTLDVTGAITGASFTGTVNSTGDLTLSDSKSIILDNAPAGDHAASGIISAFTAGENLVFGDFCYLKSDGKYWKADADASTTVPISAMAVATINADASGNFLKVGYARDDTWNWTVGGILYASTTSGGATQTAPSGSGDQVQSIGIATHADRIWFFPNFQLVEVA